MKTRLLLITLISSVLFIGGIILLTSPLGLWSYFLGIPATQIGIIFIIFTFEKLISKSKGLTEAEEEK